MGVLSFYFVILLTLTETNGGTIILPMPLALGTR